MKWDVFYHSINERKIKTFNLFDHSGLMEDMQKRLKKIKDKDTFSEALRGCLMYYFWSRSEWELIVEITEDNRVLLSPWCGCTDPENNKIDVTDDDSFDWRGFAEMHIGRQIYKNKAKVDIYDQIHYVWDDFITYVWSLTHKRSVKNDGEK